LGGSGFDVVAVSEVFNRITAQHTRRMAALGLAA
ncbi:MAG: tRNA 2-methylthio-N6-isopentenyl adenosine(37) hydroxylase MiaE-like protein, partial [Actinomycetes bacterium]